MFTALYFAENQRAFPRETGLPEIDSPAESPSHADLHAAERGEVRALWLTLGVYLVLFIAKFSVYLMTGVLALLAESLHTLSDIFISGFLLAALVWSRKEADDEHMFGHHRAQNVAALVASTLFLSFTSLRLYEEAIPHLLDTGQRTYGNLSLAIGVLAVSIVVAAAPVIGLVRQKVRGAASRAQLAELINDELGLIAALLGTLFVSWGEPIADPIATLVVATIIAVNAVGLFRDNLSMLLGRSPGAEFIGRVEREALAVPGVLGVTKIRAETIGPGMVNVSCHIQVSPTLTVAEANDIVEAIRLRVHEDPTHPGDCVIRVEPAANLLPHA